MSNRCQNWVNEYSEVRGNDRLVLLMIADEADDDGTNSFPGIDRLAHKTRLPKRTVMRAIERMEASGDIIVNRPERRGRGHFNTYVVVMADGMNGTKKGDTLTPITPGAKRVQKGRATARKGAPPYVIGSRPPDPETHNPCPEDLAANDDAPPPDIRAGFGSQEPQDRPGADLLAAVAAAAPAACRHELLADPDQDAGRAALRRRLVVLAAEVGPDAAVAIVAGEWPTSVSSAMAHANARARDYIERRAPATAAAVVNRAAGADPLDGVADATAAIAERARAREAEFAELAPSPPPPDWKAAARMKLYPADVAAPAATGARS